MADSFFSRGRAYRESSVPTFVIVRTSDESDAEIELWVDFKMVARLSFQQWSFALANRRLRPPSTPVTERLVDILGKWGDDERPSA